MNLENIIKSYSNNKNNDIEINLDKFIDLFNFEIKLKQIINNKTIKYEKYKEYYIYNYNNLYLMQFNNGSSICYNKILINKNELIINNNKLIIKIKNTNKRNNNCFESKFDYNKKKKYEVIIFKYNELYIEFYKIQPYNLIHFNYKIKIKNIININDLNYILEILMI